MSGEGAPGLREICEDYAGHEWAPMGGMDICMRCEAEREAETFDAAGCQMCGASPDDPCDCHDPQAPHDRCDYTAVEYDQGIDPNEHP